ncbi:hypothetical protein D3C86_1554570 [compost metagenome]
MRHQVIVVFEFGGDLYTFEVEVHFRNVHFSSIEILFIQFQLLKRQVRIKQYIECFIDLRGSVPGIVYHFHRQAVCFQFILTRVIAQKTRPFVVGVKFFLRSIFEQIQYVVLLVMDDLMR